MRTLIIIISIFSLSFSSIEEKGEEYQGIQFFNGTFTQAKARALLENKVIFVDAYASWCGPCKMMKRMVFTNKKVGAYYNENFINIKLDMEKGEGISLSRKWRIHSYPTLLFLDGSGNILDLAIGYHNSKEFLKLGNRNISNK